MTPPNPILLGVVGGAHGLKGEVRVKSFTEDPLDIQAYGPLSDGAGNRYTIRSARVQKSVVIVRIAEIGDRDAAERLNGTELFVDRSMLPDDEEDDEDGVYQSDLIGLLVETVAGEPVGTVAAFHDFGAGDILEIAPPRGATLMIPFSKAAVPTIDTVRGVLLVEPLAAGLADAPEDAIDPAGSDKPANDRSGDGAP